MVFVQGKSRAKEREHGRELQSRRACQGMHVHPPGISFQLHLILTNAVGGDYHPIGLSPKPSSLGPSPWVTYLVSNNHTTPSSCAFHDNGSVITTAADGRLAGTDAECAHCREDKTAPQLWSILCHPNDTGC